MVNPYDIENIASDASKYCFLDAFVKNFEQSVCVLFVVRENYLASYEDYISLLHKLGFIKFDLQKHQNEKNKIQATEVRSNSVEKKKTEESKLESPNMKPVEESQNSSSIKHTIIKTETKAMLRGKSEKPEDRNYKKISKEIKLINESWIVLKKENEEKVNTNYILLFLAGILGLYQGTKKDQEEKNEEKKTTTEATGLKTEDVTKTNQLEEKKEGEASPTEKKEEEKKDSHKVSKTEENAKRSKKDKFVNSNPFNCGVLHQRYKKSEANELKKTKNSDSKSNEILLKKVIPDFDLTLYSFSSKKMNRLKFYFRYFFDNRMNFLLKERRKNFSDVKTMNQPDLVFKPSLTKKTLKSAENYRKKCLEVSFSLF